MYLKRLEGKGYIARNQPNNIFSCLFSNMKKNQRRNKEWVLILQEN
jgi:hypothetical protein